MMEKPDEKVFPSGLRAEVELYFDIRTTSRGHGEKRIELVE